jgi:VWFA-related protein
MVFRAAVLVSLVALALGQDPPQQEQQRPPVFRTGTNLVRVDVSVTDRSGRPVHDLTENDFTVEEDGKPQQISSFKFVSVTGQPTDDYSLPIRSPQHAYTEAAREDVRVFLIFWDEYHIGEFASALRAREQLQKFVLDAFGPTDLVAIMDPLLPTDAIRFTRDRRSLADQVHKLRGRRGVYFPARSVIEEGHMYHDRGVEYVRAHVTASAIKAAAAFLGAIREGRKSIILISETLGALGRSHEQVQVVQDIIRTANNNNTAIYVLDPRGLQVGRGMTFSSDMLSALAHDTGGEPYVTNDMGRSLRKVVLQSSAFYLLGYTRADPTTDGKFHKIRVKVKRPGIDVSARNGFWAPSVGELTKAAEDAAAAELPPPVSRAFGELTPSNSKRAVDYWIGIAPGAEGACAVSLAWAPREVDDDRLTVTSVAVEASLNGDVLHNDALPLSGLTLPVKPGTLQLSFVGKNADGDIVDRERRDVAIPNPARTTLALSTPAIWRARSPLEYRAMSAPEAATRGMFAGREFRRSDRVIVRIDAYGTAAGRAEVSAKLLGQKGKQLTELPVHPGPRPGSYQLELALGSIAKGEFLVEFSAQSGSERVQALVPFRVVH